MKKIRPGQIIIEILIAVGVVTVGLLALVQLANKSISNSGVSKRQAQATAYAQEGMEWVRNQRTVQPWSTFYQSTLISGAIVNAPEFTRTITFKQLAGPIQQLDVVVDVTWQDTSGGGAASRTMHATQETVFVRY